MSDIPTAKARRLILDDPRVVNRYQETLHQYFRQHKIYKQLRRFRQTWIPSAPLTQAQVKEYEEIDAKRAIGMMLASKKCRKLKMGGRKWSPILQEARNRIKLWTMVRRRLQKCKVSVRTIIRLGKKLKIDTRGADMESSKLELDSAYTEYKVLRVQHEELHKTYREKLAQARAAEGNTKAVSEIRNIMHREKQRKTARRVKRALKKTKGMGTTKVHVTMDGATTEITNKADMEAAILAENNAKFHQTEDWCPLLRGQLAHDIGLMGEGPKVPEILDGTYICPPGTSVYTRKWLEHMQVKDWDLRKKALTSLAHFREGWKKINERTASGELHMGHFKAGCLHKEIGWFHFSMSTIPMLSGYSPQRWRQGTDVMGKC